MRWKTKEGKIINVKDMTDSHLQNAIVYLQRRLTFKSLEEVDPIRDYIKELIDEDKQTTLKSIRKGLKGLRKEKERRNKHDNKIKVRCNK